jgi:acyl-CoA thioester hydrolase
MSHVLQVRVYYEDTDAGGVVYYANYLKYLERGRSEFLRALGFEQRALAREQGLAFAVRSLSVEYLKPAKLDDLLDVHTLVEVVGRAQVIFAQSITRGAERLLTAQARIACLDLGKERVAALPAQLRTLLIAARTS